jgi:hypothetical protein
MDEEQEVVDERLFAEFDTPINNPLQIRSIDPHGFLVINYKDGGEVPEVLRGAYTTIGHATTAIKNYIAQMVSKRGHGKDKKAPEFQYQKPRDKFFKPSEKTEQVPTDGIGTEKPESPTLFE